MALTSFFAGVTKQIEVTVTVDSSPVDISSDTMTLIIKSAASDADSAALLDTNADVATLGVGGIASFNLTPEQTDIVPGRYFYDIVWYTGSDEYMVESGIVTIKTRVSDL